MAAFDTVAASYDEIFTHSLIGQYQRAQVYRCLSEVLKSETLNRVLEINCGTAEDALWLASQNLSVTATDISESMIAVAKHKDQNCLVNFRVADIKSIADDFAGENFDLVFSNFGGLNCLNPDELEMFFADVSGLLSENGKLALIIMPKNTLWEKLYFFLKGDFAEMSRRKTGKASANVDGQTVETFYYNPSAIGKMARGRFSVKKKKPIGLFIPPSYLEPVIGRKPRLASVLDRLDKMFGWSVFSRFADHYFIVLEKK